MYVQKLNGLRRPRVLVPGLVAGRGAVGLSDLVGLDMPLASRSPASGAPLPGTNCCPPDYAGQNGTTNTMVSQVASALQAMKDAKDDASLRHANRLALAAALPQTSIGFDSIGDGELTNGLIPAGASVTLSSQTVTPFRATRFVVPRSLAQFFSLTAFKMSKVEWISSDQSVPAEMFSEDSVAPPMEQAELWAGVPAIITVENVSGSAQRFRAAIWGIDLNPNSALSRR